MAVKTLYILVSNAVYIRNQLAYYETELSSNDMRYVFSACIHVTGYTYFFTLLDFFYFLLVTKYKFSKLLLLVMKYIWEVILEM